jgi:DHA2 family multidrug resistance protein
MGETLDPFNPVVAEFLAQMRQYYEQLTGDPAGAQARAVQTLADLRWQQALAVSYFDCFWAFRVVALLLIPLVLLMRPSVAARGAHVGAE